MSLDKLRTNGLVIIEKKCAISANLIGEGERAIIVERKLGMDAGNVIIPADGNGVFSGTPDGKNARGEFEPFAFVLTIQERQVYGCIRRI